MKLIKESNIWFMVVMIFLILAIINIINLNYITLYFNPLDEINFPDGSRVIVCTGGVGEELKNLGIYAQPFRTE